MSQHTKGLWRLLPEVHGHYTPGCGEYPHIENYDGEPVIDGAWYGSVCNDADLRLIAAAPDLLEALKEFIAHGEQAFGHDFEVMIQAREAIAKATTNQ